jgi:acetyl-CoA carboxylase biotin carboxyl carrier protein
MDLARIKELLRIVAESGVAEVEIEEDDFKLVVRKNAATVMVQQPMMPTYGMGYAPYPPSAPPTAYPQTPPAPVPHPAPPTDASPTSTSPSEEKTAPVVAGKTVKAPIVGTFYTAPAPDADAFVQVGDTVKVGDVLCIIEAMKLMNEIESEVAGTVKQILAENAEPVEYDQPLFVIDPA